MLPLQEARIQSLVGELSYHKPHCAAKKKKREFMGKKKTYMEKGKDVDKLPSPRGLWPQLSGQAHLQRGTWSPGWRRPGQGGRGAGKLAARGGEGAVPLTPSVQQHAGPLSPERPLVSPLARCRTGEAASQRHSPRTGVLQTQGQGAVVKAPWTHFRKERSALRVHTKSSC